MAKALGLLLCWLFPLISISSLAAESSVRMVRALSGPSGKVVSGKFVFDEIRNRFVYPQDNSLTVYFEFKAPKGDYFLTAYWKDPQGRIVTIAPDLKIQTENEELNSYWILMLDEHKTSGIWTVEVRINGEPMGSHSFELVVPEVPRPAAVAETPQMPTMDELYRSISKSLVWVHKIDGAGRRINTCTGFVVAPDAILTSFGALELATGIEIEFADGARILTNEIFSYNRAQDWALVKAATREIPPMAVGKAEAIIIGEPLIVFSVERGFSRTIGTVDITGRKTMPGSGERIFTNPQLPPPAAGGPLLDFYGKVVGIIAGTTPGLPMDARNMSAVFSIMGSMAAAPIEARMVQSNIPTVKLNSLIYSGILIPPLSVTPVFVSGEVTSASDPNTYRSSQLQFRKGETVAIYSHWQRREDIRQGNVSLRIYDANNKLRSQGKPQPLKLPAKEIVRYLSSFPAGSLDAGVYRIDVFWEDLPVWRTFIAVTN
jgi:Trypsin-like peptidase domain